jgi:hypothetical protein
MVDPLLLPSFVALDRYPNERVRVRPAGLLDDASVRDASSSDDE